MGKSRAKSGKEGQTLPREQQAGQISGIRGDRWTTSRIRGSSESHGNYGLEYRNAAR